MSQLNPLKAFAQGILGERVDRDTANITNGLSLFTIAGGRVQINLILGEVTTIMETKTITLKLTLDPTTGTTTDLCANLDMTAKEQGTLLTITGAADGALQAGSSGSVIGQAAPVIAAIGAIKAAVGATHTGSIKWSVFYIPIDDGASIVAA